MSAADESDELRDRATDEREFAADERDVTRGERFGGGGEGEPGRVRRTRTRVMVDAERGVFMISVAAELAEMHPQTLRMYEARGLIEPKRSPKGTRLYSQADVERLRRIQEMTAEMGMNLAGVERVLELEEKLEAMSMKLDSMARKVVALEDRAEELRGEVERLESLRRELRAEIVPYAAGGAIVLAADAVRRSLGLQHPPQPPTQKPPARDE